MFALDLFNTDHERRIAEGAVDQLEQRRIDDLAMKMDELVARAKTAKTAEVKQALMKEFQKCKAERDSYYMVRNETMGYGSLGEAGLPDVADKKAKMARLNQPGKVGSDAVTPQQRVNPNPDKGIIGHAADWLRGKGGPGKEGPTYEDLDEGAEDSKISIARYVYAQIMNALEKNSQFATIQWPLGTMQGTKQDATLSRNQMHFLIQRLVSMSREQRKQFTQKVLADRVATLQWLTNKKIKPAPTMPQPEVQAGQMDLNLPKPVGEARGQKKNSNKVDSPTAQNAEVQNRLRKLRAQYPSAANDVEALVQDEIATQARVDQTLGQQQAEIQQQDSALAQLNQVNRQQDSKITSLQQQLATAVRNLQQPVTKPTTATPTTTTTQPAPMADKPTSVPEPIYIPEPVTTKDQEIYNKVRDLETELKGKIDAMASWNAVAQKDPQASNELEALRKEVERTRTEIQRQVKKLKTQVKKHANSLPATDAPVKDMGTVRRVAPTPQLGQTPTDAGELGRQIGQRAQANKQAKYGKKPTAATPTDLDIIDVGQASDYLSGLRKRGRAATTVEPRQAELQIEEGTAEQFGQAVRQADQTGRELERDPEWRRLQQQKKQREKNKLRSQAGYGNDADEFGDIIDMNETVKKLQQGDPITVTAPNEFEGATGEIYDFSPSRKFVIVDLYNHGKHSMHLSDIAYNDYADDQEQDDWYDEEVSESNMSELDAMRQDLELMNDRQFMSAYGLSKVAFKQKYRTLLTPTPKQDIPVAEGFQDFNKVEPYAVCLAGKPVKKFDYYEDARRFHDNWKQKLYREGNKAKADKITLMPIMDEGWKSTLGGAAVAGAMALSAGGAHARVAGDYVDNPDINRLTGQPKVTQAVQGDQVKPSAPAGFSKEYLQSVVNGTHPRPMISKEKAQELLNQLKEAGSPAQQAAIAIAMKRAGKKPKQVDEIDRRGFLKGVGATAGLAAMGGADAASNDGVRFTQEEYDAIIDAMQLYYFCETGDIKNCQLIYLSIKAGIGKISRLPGGKQQINNAYSQWKSTWQGLKQKNPEEYQQNMSRAIQNHKKIISNLNSVVASHASAKAGKVEETALDPQDPAGDYAAKRKALQDLGMNKAVDQQAVLQRRLDLDREAKAKGIAEDTGSWIVYDPETKQIKKRFKTHTAGKSYAKTHGLGFASSEYYFDNIKDAVDEGWKQNVAAGILGATMALGSAPARANTDINVNPVQVQQMQKKADITQKYVNVLVQRAKDDGRPLDTRAMNTIKAQASDMAARQLQAQGATQQQTSQQQNFPSQGSERVVSPNYRQFEESQTDYQKRRQRERDVDAGRPVKPVPKNPQTDYARKRAKDRKDMEMGEGWYNPKSFPGVKIGPHIAGPQRTSPAPQVKDQIIKLLMAAHKDLVDRYGQRDVNIVAQAEAAKTEPTPQGIRKAANNVINFLTSGSSVNRLRQQTLEDDSVAEMHEPQKFIVTINGKATSPLYPDMADRLYAAAKQAQPDARVEKTPAPTAQRQKGIDRVKAGYGDEDALELHEQLPSTPPANRKEYLDQRDKLFRMMAVDSNPANKQIIKQAIKDLDARYGSAKDPIREEYSTASEAVEIAVIRRILVAHVDLIMEFGLDKVTQAIEEVAYNVGDVDEIGTSDVSAYVDQVKQILGAE
jgi:HAMP domain-containing protein